MRLISANYTLSFVLQQPAMKKLIAFVLILMIVLNAAVLLQKSEARQEGEKTLALKISRIDLKDVKPGILPGLLKF